MKRFLFSLFLFFSVAIVYCQVNTTFEAKKSALKIELYDAIYSKLSYEDAVESVSEEGSPSLPVLTKIYLLPPGAVASDLSVSLTRQTAISGDYLVFPVQPPVVVNDAIREHAFVLPDSAIYSSDQMFPSVPFECVEEDVFGYRVCKVKFYPFSYLPTERKLFRNKFQIQLNEESIAGRSDASQAQPRVSALRSKLAREYVMSLVENPSDLSVYYPSSQMRLLTSSGITPITNPDFLPDYLIITNEELKSSFQVLADWKTKKGFVTYIKTVEEIYASYPGIDRQEQIRNYIIESVGKWGTSLFVLLGGDVNIIPAREHLTEYPYYYGRVFYPADSYYANTNPQKTWNANYDNIFGDTGDGASHTRNIVLGRIPADSKTKASTLITKILAYEKANDGIDYSYLNNSLLVSGITTLDNNTPADDNNQGIKDLINLYDTFLKTRMNCRFLFDQRFTSYPGFSNMTQKVDGLYSHLTRNSFIEGLNGSDIKPHIVYHKDHSGPQSMGTSNKTENQGINNADVDALLNGKYYHIMMTGGCNPGNFSKDCIGEHFLFKNQGGAVAFLGNTDAGTSIEAYMFTSFIKSIFNSGSNRVGLAHKAIFSTYSYKWNMHLLGDPEMPVWTSAPKDVTVTTSLQKQTDGSYLLTVNTSNLDSEAVICVSKANDFYYVGEVQNGSYQYSLSPVSSGLFSVVVTAQNYRPFAKSFVVSGTHKKTVTCTQSVIDDSSGNGDGKADAGETPSLRLTLKNTSATAISGLTATVSCNTPLVELNTTQLDWGALAAGSSKEVSFSFSVDKDAEERLKSAQDAVTFHFDITDASGNKYYLADVKIDILKPELILELTGTTRPTYTGNYPLKYRITNSSLGEAHGLQATFSGQNSIYTITVPCGSLAAQRDSVYSTNLYVLGSYPVGTNTPLPVTLTLRNQYGKEWTQTFDLNSLPAALSLTGDQCDYTCDADWIQVYWKHRSGVKGYNVYRSDVDDQGDPVGVYHKQNKEPLQFPFYTDYNVEELTAYSYKASVISSDGIESPLSDSEGWNA